MKYIYISLAFVLFCGLTACNTYQKEFEEESQKQALLKEHVEELEEEAKFINGEYEDALTTLSAIEDSLRTIADRDQKIQRLLAQSEMASDVSQADAIMVKVTALRDANNKSKEEAKRLKNKARALKVENKKIQKMIDQADERVLQLDAELDTAKTMIGDMQSALALMENDLSETNSKLGTAYINIKEQNTKLEKTNKELEETISELNAKKEFIGQDAQAYVVCGDRRSLRKNKILSDLSVKKLNKNYHSMVKEHGSPINFFDSDEIACSGEGEIINVLPARDLGSYKIQGDAIIIKNAKDFWATDKVVVIVKK
ncbi:MAG: hypothetical protein GY810_01930 [Aureispira sp.]|nr:hypothetical protein [Aureispira sp.]